MLHEPKFWVLALTLAAAFGEGVNLMLTSGRRILGIALTAVALGGFALLYFGWPESQQSTPSISSESHSSGGGGGINAGGGGGGAGAPGGNGGIYVSPSPSGTNFKSGGNGGKAGWTIDPKSGRRLFCGGGGGGGCSGPHAGGLGGGADRLCIDWDTGDLVNLRTGEIIHWNTSPKR